MKSLTGGIMIVVGVVLATALGVYGQDIAYFLNDQFMNMKPVYYLTVITVASVAIYIATFIVARRFTQEDRKEKQVFFLSAIAFIGVITSCWSILILIAWWG